MAPNSHACCRTSNILKIVDVTDMLLLQKTNSNISDDL